MPIAAPFIARPMRQVGTALPDSTLDRIDALRMMTGMPSRSAILAELIELGLALHEDPQNAIKMLIDGMIDTYGGGATAADTLLSETGNAA